MVRTTSLALALSVVVVGCGSTSEGGSGATADGGTSSDGDHPTGTDGGGGIPDGGAGLGRTACEAEALRTTGTTYFICDCASGAAPGCVPGSDTNSGTSASAPWQTTTKAFETFRTMAAGSTVAFCRGGSWANVVGMWDYGGGRLINQNCSAGAWSAVKLNQDPALGAANPAVGTCDMRDYTPPEGAANAPKPKLAMAHVGDLPNEFTSAGQNIFAHMGWYHTPEQAPITGFRFMNLELVASSGGERATENAFVLWGSTSDVDLCGLDMHAGFGAALGVTTASTTNRVTLRSSRIYDNYGSSSIAVIGLAGNDITVDSNFFDHNGGDVFGGRSHTIYFAQSAPETTCAAGITKVGGYCLVGPIRLTNNEISRSAWGAGTSCSGTAVVAHDAFHDVLIENNFIHEHPGTAQNGCYGVGFTSGGEAAYFPNFVFRRNRIFNLGWKGLALAGAPDAVIEDNVFVMPLLGGSAQCVSYPDVAYVPGPDAQSANGRVVNNTCYLPGGSGGEYAYRGFSEGSGHVFANNVALFGAGAAMCVDAPSGATVATNLCTGSAVDPYFVNASPDPSSADFRARDGSPLIDAATANVASTVAAGAARWSASDKGIARPVGAGSDVGAFER